MASSLALSDAEIADYGRDGYVPRRALFDAGESQRLRAAFAADGQFADHLNVYSGGDGRQSEFATWYRLGDDVFGAIARSERMVKSAARLLDDEPYHWHSKVIMKPPRTGGEWIWHQDYGIWYDFGCLYSRMLAVMIAIDATTRENGCLEVLAGSHHMGRISHEGGGETQRGADPERLAEAIKRCERVTVEMAPGDALFFHANLLHASGPNTSARPRNVLIVTYNARSNSPYKATVHPAYSPIDVLPDAAVRDAAITTNRDREFYSTAILSEIEWRT